MRYILTQKEINVEIDALAIVFVNYLTQSKDTTFYSSLTTSTLIRSGSSKYKA